MESTNADRETTKHVDGLYIGMLDADEMESFNQCVKDEIACRDYSGPGGLLGLAKVKYTGA